MEGTKSEVITGPDSRILEALRGKISKPRRVISRKAGIQGQEITVRLVEEGAGMAGLEDTEDNKEWAGIFNHLVKTARIATFLAQELKKTGENVDARLVLNSVLISHAGRRQWDEANWYPEAVENALEKAAMGDQPLTMEILSKADIPGKIMDVVDVHAGDVKKIDQRYRLEEIVAYYTDWRVSQNVMSLEERFDAFQKSPSFTKVTPEHFAEIKEWAFRTEEEIFSRLAIKPEDITDNFPPVPRWEKYLRRLYINDAEEGIFSRLSQLHQQINAGEIGEEQLDKEFPQNTWWGKYVGELFDARKGQPLHPRVGKQIGMARAIEFYRWLETTNLGGKAKNLPRRPIE